jgi:mitochondrial chaperone BCS1
MADLIPSPDALAEGQNLLLGQVGLPMFILTTFFPSLLPKLAQHPKLVRLFSIPFAMWIGYEFLAAKLASLWYKLMSNGMSSVTISSEDGRLHGSFSRFLRSKKLLMSERVMSATSLDYLKHSVNGGHHRSRHIGGGKPVVFEPVNKYQFFWHKRRLFVTTVSRSVSAHQHGAYKQDITVWTFGWSPEPIRSMLSEAYDDANKEGGKVLTRIFVPYNRGDSWLERSSKPCRPLASVYLPEGQKQALLDDISEYVDPDTRQWYEDRGVPHRRGYLFHGQPGCGKTTLAMAVAGKFKLNIYMISLQDPNINDANLMQLFQSIGRGSLLLLEDVDCAGLEKRNLGKKAANNDGDDNDDQVIIGPRRKSKVTLSGLLNAIDGAGAPEGHILIMTTNDPDALDEALVRAGRVDVKVPFSYATRSQIRDIFVNMYHPGGPGADSWYNGKGVEGAQSTSEDKNEPVELSEEEKKRRDETILTHKLAGEFAELVPELSFAPAQLQEYILIHKNKPQRAIDEVREWVATKLGDRENSSPVSSTDYSEDDSAESIFSNGSQSTVASSVDGESLSDDVDRTDTTKKAKTRGLSKTATKAALAKALHNLDPEQLQSLLAKAKTVAAGSDGEKVDKDVDTDATADSISVPDSTKGLEGVKPASEEEAAPKVIKALSSKSVRPYPRTAEFHPNKVLPVLR